MLQNLTSEFDISQCDISYQVGSAKVLDEIQFASPKEPFSDDTVSFLNQLSKLLLSDGEAKAYSDIITFAFWIRKASVQMLKERFLKDKEIVRIGRGVAFHIAPSNVAVNYAYSLATGLLCGNANIVRIPSKDFPQVSIINRAINKALIENTAIAPYIVLIRYGHDRAVNDVLSSIADIRVIWGGDGTIFELRKSVLKPRATEIAFADRFSLAVIDSDAYMKIENKDETANAFYNDTYLSDQNACTSARIVIWFGDKIEDAKKEFWSELHKIVAEKYEMQSVQIVNKLSNMYLLATVKEDARMIDAEDNLITRIHVNDVSSSLMDYKESSGFFFEYDCKDALTLRDLCNDTRCQTIAYIGNSELLTPLFKRGVKGIDRIVPVGKTMDFDLIWDGYNLFERFTRSIMVF